MKRPHRDRAKIRAHYEFSGESLQQVSALFCIPERTVFRKWLGAVTTHFYHRRPGWGIHDLLASDPDTVTCKGQASILLDRLFMRRQLNLATPKQVRLLRRMGVPDAETIGFEEAHKLLAARFNPA